MKRANDRENEGEERVDSFDQGRCQHRIAAVASTEDLRGENKGWFRSATVFHPLHPKESHIQNTCPNKRGVSRSSGGGSFLEGNRESSKATRRSRERERVLATKGKRVRR